MVHREDDPWGRLLSHRLRGFDQFESSLQAMEAALAAGVRHVEFDVRVTKDGALIAFHDPFFQADDGSWEKVEAWDLEALRRQRSLQHVATVATMVDLFAARSTPESRLHIDVKVAGRTDALLSTLQEAGVLEQTVLVSWLPGVLQAFHARATQVPVCFSHISFARALRLYSVAKQLARDSWRQRAAAAIGSLLPHAATLLATARLSFADDGDPSEEIAPEDLAGCNHAQAVPDLLAGRMLRLLQETKGFAALPAWCADRVLVERYHGLGVKVAVFAAKNALALNRMLATGVDIVYVDDARLFGDAAQQVRDHAKPRAE